MLRVYALEIERSMDEARFESLLDHVSAEKIKKIREFIRTGDKFRSLFSDLLARYIVMNETGMKNQDVQFIYNKYGKPYLKGYEDCFFNISYSGSWVVGAFDRKPVGIDVEEVKDMDFDVSDYLFSFEERRALKRSADKRSYFFSIWTLKESFSKFIGTGSSLPFETISFRLQEQNTIDVSLAGKRLHNVYFNFYNIDSSYKMALCAAHDKMPVNVVKLNSKGLQETFV